MFNDWFRKRPKALQASQQASLSLSSTVSGNLIKYLLADRCFKEAMQLFDYLCKENTIAAALEAISAVTMGTVLNVLSQPVRAASEIAWLYIESVTSTILAGCVLAISCLILVVFSIIHCD